MLSTSGNWLFVHVPRTGGNSLQRALVDSSDDRLLRRKRGDPANQFGVVGPHTRHKHATAADYRSELGAERFARLFRFATVRNPWERAISWYFAPIRWSIRPRAPHWSEDGFAAEIGRLAPIVDYVCIDGALALDEVLRFERYAEDAASLLRRLGIEAELPHVNASAVPGAWERYYAQSPELVALVGDRFREDVELFGYEPPAV